MNKTISNIFKTIIIGGLITAASATASFADVVEVSSLPGTSVAYSSSVNTVNASGGASAVNSSSGVITDTVSTVTASMTAQEATSVSQTKSSQAETSGNYVTAYGNYSQNTVTTPVITAVSSLSDADTGSSFIKTGSTSTASVNSVNTVSVPVIIAESDISGATARVSSVSSGNPVNEASVPVVVATGSTDDSSAREATASEVGFCVLLGSSPTGTMKDITG